MPPLDFPTSPTNGQTLTGPGGVLWTWDGAKWVGPPSPPTGVLIAASPPTANPGTLWWDTTGGQLYVRYDDGVGPVQWVSATNIMGIANAATKADVATALNNVGRNVIHNGQFNIWQRSGAPWTTTGAFTADRWMMGFVGGTMSVNSTSFTDAARAQVGDETAALALTATVAGTGGAADESYFEQRIEDTRRLAGKTVTVSFWVAATAGTPRLGVSMYQSMGTGGSPSTGAGVQGQAVTLSTTYTRYVLTYTLPSLAGKTLGTTVGTDYTILRFAMSAGSNANAGYGTIGVQSYTLAIWGIQLEIGPTVTLLEKEDRQQTFAKCQRFFQVAQPYIQGYGAAGQQVAVSSPSIVTMRANPTVTVRNNYSSNVGTIVPAGQTNLIYITAPVTATGAFVLNAELNSSAEL